VAYGIVASSSLAPSHWVLDVSIAVTSKSILGQPLLPFQVRRWEGIVSNSTWAIRYRKDHQAGQPKGVVDVRLERRGFEAIHINEKGEGYLGTVW
jgi:hypothetical protein